MSIVAAAMPRILIGFAFLVVVVAICFFLLLSSHHNGLRSKGKTMLLITLANLEQVVCAKKKTKMCIPKQAAVSKVGRGTKHTQRKKSYQTFLMAIIFFSVVVSMAILSVNQYTYLYPMCFIYLHVFFFSFVSHMSRSCEPI